MVNNAIDICNSGFNQSKKTSVNPYFGYLYQFGQIQGYQLHEKIYPNMSCDAPKPGGPLTTSQPAEYKWRSGYPTLL